MITQLTICLSIYSTQIIKKLIHFRGSKVQWRKENNRLTKS